VLTVDGTRCDGHGICALHCPDLIRLDQWGYAGVVPESFTDRALRRRALRAIAACPEQALSIRPGRRANGDGSGG
jgi:ferredoxin